MELNKLAVVTSAAFMASPAFSADVIPEDVFKKLKVYGSVNGNVVKVDDHDHQTQIQLATVGMTGIHETEYGNALVNLAVEYADNEKQDNAQDIYVSQANLWFVNKKYGKLVLGNGYKGAYVHMFKPVDIFDANNQHRSSGSTLFVNQSQLGTNTLSYTTPTFLGGFTATAGVVSAFDENDKEADNFALRLMYNAENYSIKFQRSDANGNDSDAMKPGDSNTPNDPGGDHEFERYIGMAEYHNDTFAIAATYEFASDHFMFGDGHLYGVAGTYHVTDALTFKLGYQNSKFDNQVGKWLDDSLYLANVSFDLSKNLRVYAEYADFSENTQDDNVALGAVFKF